MNCQTIINPELALLIIVMTILAFSIYLLRALIKNNKVTSNTINEIEQELKV